jgi:hypothetical protein
METKTRPPLAGGNRAGIGNNNRDSYTRSSVANQPIPTASPFYGMEIIDWKPRSADGLLIGHAAVRLAIGLEIRGIPVFNSPGGVWASTPSEPLRDRAGRYLTDSNTGKRRYSNPIKWVGRGLQDEWSREIILLIEDRYGGAALKGGGDR